MAEGMIRMCTLDVYATAEGKVVVKPEEGVHKFEIGKRCEKGTLEQFVRNEVANRARALASSLEIADPTPKRERRERQQAAE